MRFFSWKMTDTDSVMFEDGVSLVLDFLTLEEAVSFYNWLLEKETELRLKNRKKKQ